jgi:hypothetical protein
MTDCCKAAIAGWMLSGAELLLLWGIIYNYYFKNKMVTQILPILPLSKNTDSQTTPKLKYNGVNNSTDLFGANKVDVIRNLRNIESNTPHIKLKPNPMDI